MWSQNHKFHLKSLALKQAYTRPHKASRQQQIRRSLQNRDKTSCLPTAKKNLEELEIKQAALVIYKGAHQSCELNVG